MFAEKFDEFRTIVQEKEESLVPTECQKYLFTCCSVPKGLVVLVSQLNFTTFLAAVGQLRRYCVSWARNRFEAQIKSGCPKICLHAQLFPASWRGFDTKRYHGLGAEADYCSYPTYAVLNLVCHLDNVGNKEPRYLIESAVFKETSATIMGVRSSRGSGESIVFVYDRVNLRPTACACSPGANWCLFDCVTTGSGDCDIIGRD